MGNVAEYQEASLQVLHNIGWNRFEVFVNDSWKTSPRLTLNYGARPRASSRGRTARRMAS